ncbi:protein of unknown function [Magnetospirillum sp. XM-1]|uniref:hypothetical protein n=1 Tax=Magnetospirillum sp. XM-1 TaxID=1663591 RepID=UPI00073E008C|nr:hypothetical protein [Magnetospirillum sp. XM-1]CUW41668.1 protein of unknown function [Magnetospirillum sp. XM-1]
MTRILYVCDLCEPEYCGHDNRTELRVYPGDDDFAETTMCNNCWSEWKNWHGNMDARPDWDTMPAPAEHLPHT